MRPKLDQGKPLSTPATLLLGLGALLLLLAALLIVLAPALGRFDRPKPHTVRTCSTVGPEFPRVMSCELVTRPL